LCRFESKKDTRQDGFIKKGYGLNPTELAKFYSGWKSWQNSRLTGKFPQKLEILENIINFNSHYI
jgi:hypothetical protein